MCIFHSSGCMFLRPGGPGNLVARVWCPDQSQLFSVVPKSKRPGCVSHPHHPLGCFSREKQDIAHTFGAVHQFIDFCYCFPFFLGFRWNWSPGILMSSHSWVCSFLGTVTDFQEAIHWGPLPGLIVSGPVGVHVVHIHHLHGKVFVFFFLPWSISCCSLLGKIVMIFSLILAAPPVWRCGEQWVYESDLSCPCLSPSFLHPDKEEEGQEVTVSLSPCDYWLVKAPCSFLEINTLLWRLSLMLRFYSLCTRVESSSWVGELGFCAGWAGRTALLEVTSLSMLKKTQMESLLKFTPMSPRLFS